MPENASYDLIDFGNGRKLERFGEMTLDRPCPAAEGQQRGEAAIWSAADARFLRASTDIRAQEEGRWTGPGGRPGKGTEDWKWGCETLSFRMKLTPYGHVGVFPEQRSNWSWIARRIRHAARAGGAEPPRLLNLFAYTGGSTLAAAAAGAAVTHVDSSRPVVQWARDNALLSNLADAPIRWLVEDARKFVRRELKRGNRYDALVLDPPSYGHGPKGERWRVTHDLMPLLEDCRRLLPDRPIGVVLTCHSAGYGPAELAAVLQETMFGRCSMDVSSNDLFLNAVDGRQLHAGVVARFPAGV